MSRLGVWKRLNIGNVQVAMERKTMLRDFDENGKTNGAWKNWRRTLWGRGVGKKFEKGVFTPKHMSWVSKAQYVPWGPGECTRTLNRGSMVWIRRSKGGVLGGATDKGEKGVLDWGPLENQAKGVSISKTCDIGKRPQKAPFGLQPIGGGKLIVFVMKKSVWQTPLPVPWSGQRGWWRRESTDHKG